MSADTPPRSENRDPFANYRALTAKVDAHFSAVAGAHPLRCGRGCTACCHVQLSVSRVEADFILELKPRATGPAGRGLLDEHPLFDALAGPAPCVFLGPEGDCAIYERRPLICRSHGVPVRVDGEVDACPLNEGLQDAPVLSLELLNTTLTAINALYCRETGRPADRVSLVTIAAATVDIPG